MEDGQLLRSRRGHTSPCVVRVQCRSQSCCRRGSKKVDKAQSSPHSRNNASSPRPGAGSQARPSAGQGLGEQALVPVCAPGAPLPAQQRISQAVPWPWARTRHLRVNKGFKITTQTSQGQGMPFGRSLVTHWKN